MISHTAVVPVRGELVGITLDWENGPILFVGWVVRHIDDGFAIEFDHLSEAAAAFLDDSVGVVPTPGQGRVE